MIDLLLEHEYLLRVLLCSPPKLCSAIIEHSPNSLLLCLCSCAINLLNHKIPVTDTELETFKSQRVRLHALADRTQSYKKKRELLLKPASVRLIVLVVEPVLRALDEETIH